MWRSWGESLQQERPLCQHWRRFWVYLWRWSCWWWHHLLWWSVSSRILSRSLTNKDILHSISLMTEKKTGPCAHSSIRCFSKTEWVDFKEDNLLVACIIHAFNSHVLPFQISMSAWMMCVTRTATAATLSEASCVSVMKDTPWPSLTTAQKIPQAPQHVRATLNVAKTVPFSSWLLASSTSTVAAIVVVCLLLVISIVIAIIACILLRRRKKLMHEKVRSLIRYEYSTWLSS